MRAARFLPSPQLKFKIKKSKKKITCSAGDRVGTCRSKEVRGASLTGYDTLLQAYPVMSPL